MGKDFRECPDGVFFENNMLNQLILAWKGKGEQGVPLRLTSVDDDTLYAGDFRNHGSGGKHLRATHSSGSPVLLDVTDAGVLLSVDGGAATNSLVYPKTVIGWTGTAATIPSGYGVLAASQSRFPYGAAADGDLGTTGGAATINLQHTHVQDPHSHSHDHDMDHDHDTNIDHSHGTIESEPASTGGGNDDESAPVAGTGQIISLQPHEHDVIIPSYDVDPRTSSAPEPDALTDIDATPTTAVNQNAGNTAQSILPPYFRMYFLERAA